MLWVLMLCGYCRGYSSWMPPIAPAHSYWFVLDLITEQCTFRHAEADSDNASEMRLAFCQKELVKRPT